jgi:hypothetical protein
LTHILTIADEVAVDASLFADLDLEDLETAESAAPARSIFQDQTFSDDD